MVNIRTGMKDYTYQQGTGTLHKYEWKNPIIAAAVNLVQEYDTFETTQGAPETGEIDNIQFSIQPPVDIAQFMMFLRESKGILLGNVEHIIGSYQDGCIVTMNLTDPTTQADISAILTELSKTLGIKIVF